MTRRPNMQRINKIREEVRKHKNGIWLDDLKDVTGFPKSSIQYNIFGQEKNGITYGAELKTEMEIKHQGKNTFIKLKGEK